MPLDTDELTFVASADLHAGSISPERLSAVFHAAGASGTRFFAAAGDITDSGAPVDYEQLDDLVSGLEMPFFPVMGNHDFHTLPTDEARSLFCRVFGLETPSYTRTECGIPFAFLSTDRNINGCRVAVSESIPMLQAALCESTGPLIVFCHAPLSDTVGGVPDRPCFVSSDPEFGLTESDAVREFIAESHRPVVWISGHTHPPLDAENLIMTEMFDGHPLHSVNLMCPYYTSRDGGRRDPVALYHFRVRPAEMVVEIRDVRSGETLRTESLPLA
jgi:predicted phosphodiesterase